MDELNTKTIKEEIKDKYKIFNNSLQTMAKNLTSKKDENRDFMQNLKKAQWDWQKSQIFFQNVSDPDLVDYAIYKMEASRLKYIYLLKQAREKGIKARII